MSKQKFSINDRVTIKIISKKNKQNDKKINNYSSQNEQKKIIKE